VSRRSKRPALPRRPRRDNHLPAGAQVQRRRPADHADGATIKIKVKCALVILKDNDPDARNPVVIAPNLNRGNKQIGHRINRVLRPVDL
jgi:hypothetical protein